MDKGFMEECMSKRVREVAPSAIEITSPVEIDKLTLIHNRLSSYFLDGAKSMQDSDTPLLAILLGYFAMEQKAYEILAWKNLKVSSHICAIKGLSRVVGKKALASSLSVAYENRLEVNYLGNIKTAELDRDRAKKFVEEMVFPFISEIDMLIESEG